MTDFDPTVLGEEGQKRYQEFIYARQPWIKVGLDSLLALAFNAGQLSTGTRIDKMGVWVLAWADKILLVFINQVAADECMEWLSKDDPCGHYKLQHFIAYSKFDDAVREVVSNG